MAYRSFRYNPKSSAPFTLSRTKIELYLECSYCFYLNVRLGIRRPGIPAFTLNSAVDQLLKNEFDLLRKNGQQHELMKQYHIEALPLAHPDLSLWRGDVSRFSGAKVLHNETNFIVDGLIDDIWQGKDGLLYIVDYKATSTEREISLNDEYKQGYKRQMEVYQWIFKRMGFPVSNIGYFVFANAGRNKPTFDGILEFKLSIVSHQGDDSWLEPTLFDIKNSLREDKLPKESKSCEYCLYRGKINSISSNHQSELFNQVD